MADEPAAPAAPSLGGAVYGDAPPEARAAESLTPVAADPAVADPAAAADPVADPGASDPVADPAVAADPVVDPADPPAEEPAADDPPAELTLDSYADLTLDEGFTINEPTMASYKDFALANKLTPEQASAGLKLYQEAAKAQVEAAQAAFNETQTKWVAEIKAMPEFATEEAHAASLAAIGKVVDEFGTPAVRDILDATGAGNNPEVVKMFLKLAGALNEGQVRPQGAPAKQSPKNQTLGQALYGDTKTA